MSGEIVKEWYFWLVSIATGVFMAFAYDVVRLFRRLVKHGRLAVDLEDILYWTACFGLSFTLLYYGNNGVIRFAAVFGAAIGMCVYAVTVGRFFVRVCYLVIDRTIGSLLRLIRKIVRKLRALLRPVKCFVVKKCRHFKYFFIRLYQKIRLTCIGNRHKMKVHSQVHNHKRAKGGEGRRPMAGKKARGRRNAKTAARRTNQARRKTPEFLRAKNENRLGMIIALLAIAITTGVVGLNSISLRQKEKAYAAREEELLQQIAVEEARAKELEEFATYTKTKKYAEEVAKDKLGLVYENEIIFQETD